MYHVGCLENNDLENVNLENNSLENNDLMRFWVFL